MKREKTNYPKVLRSQTEELYTQKRQRVNILIGNILYKEYVQTYSILRH